jgi:hypothetical protein
MRPGPYYGVGPRGYRRSDHRIREEVCERLTQHGFIDAHLIRVRVEDGEVTLTGSVRDRGTKRMAEDTAASVAAVADVHNLLRLNRLPGRAETRERAGGGSESRRSDPQLPGRKPGRRGRQGALVFETNGDKEE